MKRTNSLFYPLLATFELTKTSSWDSAELQNPKTERSVGNLQIDVRPRTEQPKVWAFKGKVSTLFTD